VELAAARNRWVTVHYRLFDSQGEAVEDGEREITYLHGGYGEIFEPIEHALEGQAAGFQTSVYLEPEQTFGDYDPDLIRLAQRA
jgi:FKBP-type peptidyl-prolyl cis-trans isomerase SlyD